MNHPDRGVGVEPRLHKVLEGFGALQRAGVGHQHPADGPIAIGDRDNRPHTGGHQPLEAVGRLGHHVMLKEATQAEYAEVVIPHEIGGDFKRVASSLAGAVGHAGLTALAGKQFIGLGDLGRHLLHAVVPQFGRQGLDPDADGPRAGPLEPGLIDDRQAKQFRPVGLGQFDRMTNNRLGRAAGS